MRFKEFYVCDSNNESNCVIRSFCNVYNEEYENVYKELCEIAKELNCESFNEVDVFETYMKRRDTISLDYGNDLKVKDLKLDKGKYLVFCWDKESFYHMVSIIDNVLYDRKDDSLDLYVIKIYKEKYHK